MQLSNLYSLAGNGTVDEFKALLHHYGDKRGMNGSCEDRCIDWMVNGIMGTEDQAAKVAATIDYLGARGNVDISLDEGHLLAKASTADGFKTLLDVYGNREGMSGSFGGRHIDWMVNGIAGSHDEMAKVSAAIEYLGAKGNVKIGVDEASHLAKLSTAEEFQTLLGVYGDKMGSDGCFRRAYIDCMVNAIAGSKDQKDQSGKVSAAINNLGATGVNFGLDQARILAKKSTAQDFQTLLSVYGSRMGRSGSFSYPYIDYMIGAVTGNLPPAAESAAKRALITDYTCKQGVFKCSHCRRQRLNSPLPPLKKRKRAATTL